MMVQASAMIGANGELVSTGDHQASSLKPSPVYQASDSPRYFHANKGLIGLLSFNVVSESPNTSRSNAQCSQVLLYPGTWLYYRWRNRSRAAIWDAMTEEEKENYLLTTKDQGNKRYVFVHN